MEEKIRTYWDSLAKREQNGLVIAVLVLVLAFFHFGLVNPLVNRANTAEQTLKNEKQLATWVANKVAQIKSYSGQSTQATAVSMPLNQAVTSSVSSYSLKIIRLQPQQNDLQVWLEPMPFNNLLRWLDLLEKRYAIVVKFIELDKGSAEGMVEIKRLELGRT